MKDELYRKEVKENERKTNKIVAFVLLAFVILSLFNSIAFHLTYVEGLKQINLMLFVPISVVLIAMDVIALIYKFDKPWVKKMLLAGVILMSVVAFFTFTTYTIYFAFLPIYIATRYFNKKTIYKVSIITALFFMAACVLNVIFDPAYGQEGYLSKVVGYMHNHIYYYNIWLDPLSVMIYLIFPTLLIMIFLMVYSINLTKSGRNLIREIVDNHKKISSVETELLGGAEIQKSMLPAPKYITENGNFLLEANEIPAKEVCGDFYDYFMLNKNIMIVLVADVSDKGIPAAMFMMSAKKAIQCAVSVCHDLESSIALANKLICSDNEYGMFLTLWLAAIDIKSGIGKFVNAGHPSPIIIHADKTAELIENEPDLFLGNFPDFNPTVNYFRMRKDDILVLYTDGLTDGMNKAGERFGIDGIISTINNNAGGTVLESLVKSVTEFTDGEKQFDDITVLTLKCNKTNKPKSFSRHFKIGKDATKQINDEIQGLLTDTECPDEKRRNIGVVIDEICNNINMYSKQSDSDEFEINFKLGDNFLKIEFADRGEPFNPLEHEDPVIGDIPQFGGLGIFFVKQLSDSISYEYSENKNRLSVFFVWNL